MYSLGPLFSSSGLLSSTLELLLSSLGLLSPASVLLPYNLGLLHDVTRMSKQYDTRLIITLNFSYCTMRFYVKLNSDK